jgi:bifunctional non-homologous end joining protein LigD
MHVRQFGMAGAVGSIKEESGYLDGELCALNGNGVPVFSRLQAAMDEGRMDQLVFSPSISCS